MTRTELNTILSEEMSAEYDAWQVVVQECRLLGIDMNDKQYDRLIGAVCVWGERLHALRGTQQPEQIEKALNSYLAHYEAAKQAA